MVANALADRVARPAEATAGQQALETGGPDRAVEPSTSTPARATDPEPPIARAAVRPYDFRRPPGLDRHHVRSLQLLFEVLSQRGSGALTAGLGLPVHLRLNAVEQMTWEGYVASIQEPTALMTFSLHPFPGRAVLDVPIGLAMYLVDVRLGGRGTGPYPARALNDLEEALVSEVVGRVAAEVPPAFSPAGSLSVGPLTHLSDARFLPSLPSAEMCVVAELALQADRAPEVPMTFCLPSATTRPLVEALEQSSRDGGGGLADDGQARALERALDVAVEVAVRFPSTVMTPSELTSLRPGDVVQLMHAPGGALQVLVGGHPCMLAVDSTVGRRLCCTIIEGQQEGWR